MKVNGTVMSVDSVPLANVIVVVTGTNVVAETKADGKFSLNVPKGRTHLFVSAMGYETQQIPAKAQMDIYLRQASLDPGFIRVDCAGEDGKMLPPDEIFAKVKSVTDERLKLK